MREFERVRVSGKETKRMRKCVSVNVCVRGKGKKERERKKNLKSIEGRDEMGGQGQYWLFHYQKSDFRHFQKSL